MPYWVYQDEANYRAELRRLFEGPTWNYVCLESDVAQPGRVPHDLRGRDAGDRGARRGRRDPRLREPLRPPRGPDRPRRRRAAPGASSASTTPGTTICCGNLVGVAFERGSHGKGGMPADFCKADHGPRKLHTATLCGLVFATLSDDTPPIKEYLGDEIRGRIERVLRSPVQVLGRFTQTAAQQLEALLREREGHLPREPAPRLLRHLPHHAPDPGRRRGREPGGRAPRQLHHRPGRGPDEHRVPGAGHPLGAARAIGSTIRACSTPSTSSATASSSRS